MQNTILKNNLKYNLTINNFEGPLDLLVFLISKNKMNIFDISLSELTDEYIEYLDKTSELDLEITSEFIVMAATLLDIKARKLLPEIEPKEDEDDHISEEDLINRIIAYKKYKEISAQINDLYSEYFGSFSKPIEKIKYKTKVEYTGQKLEPQELFNIYFELLERNKNKINTKAKEIEKLAIYEKITVKDKVIQIVDYLKSNENMVFNNVFNVDVCEKIEVVTAFLGALELSKLKQVSLNQQLLFSNIDITRISNETIDLNNMNFG